MADVIRSAGRFHAGPLIFRLSLSLSLLSLLKMGDDPREQARRFAQYMGYLSGFDLVVSMGLFVMCGDEVSEGTRETIAENVMWCLY